MSVRLTHFSDYYVTAGYGDPKSFDCQGHFISNLLEIFSE